MQRLVVTSAGILMLLLHITTVRTQQQAAKPAAAQPKNGEKSYFLMDVNGSYRYGFDAGNGIEGAQSADQTNEVTGHYTYIEKGIPYMVKYRAGVKGYQPEVITVAGAATQTPSGSTFGRLPAEPNVLNTILHSQNAQQSHKYTPTATLISSGKVQPTLQFIQAALQTMQRQPLHMSFNTQNLPAQLLNGNVVPSTAQPTAVISPTLVTQLNRLPEPTATPSATAFAQSLKQPYAFAYGGNGDLTTRSESADAAGNVVGKYSYRDEAGYHDLTYKAGDNTGFLIVGGNLANLNGANSANLNSNLNFNLNAVKSNQQSAPQLVVSVTQEPHGSYNYKVQPLQELISNTLKDANGRVLRKF